jgi:hypothetical protein
MRCFDSPFKTRAFSKSFEGWVFALMVVSSACLGPHDDTLKTFVLGHAARGDEEQPENKRPERIAEEKIGVSPRRDHDLSTQSGNSEAQ